MAPLIEEYDRHMQQMEMQLKFYQVHIATLHKCSHYSEVLRLSGLDGADFMLSALNCSLIPNQVNLSYNKLAIQEYTFSQSSSSHHSLTRLFLPVKLSEADDRRQSKPGAGG